MKKVKNGIEKSMLVGGLSLALALSLSAATLCENGSSDYAIVCGTNAQDRVAAAELQNIFARSTGVTLPVVTNGVSRGAVGARGLPARVRHVMYVGQVPDAEAVFGKDDLRVSEYAVTEKKPTLGLFGGGDFWFRGRGWNGTMLAVYAFCEEVLGYRHFLPTKDGERIVKRMMVKTNGFRLRRAEAFPFGHELFMTYLYPAEVSEFCTRNGATLPEARYARTPRYNGLVPDCLHKDSGHGFMLYMPCKRIYMDTYPWDERIDFFAQHPEWFSMDRTGKRTDRMQLCFSNGELRKAFTKRVLERCRRVGGKGILTIGAQDVPGAFCWCPACQVLQKKYATPAGAYYDYLPELCAAVAKDYPEIRIQTLAYRKEQTENFPKGIETFPDNFICDFAPVDDNQAFNIGGRGNEKTLANLKKWRQACKTVKYWYYACSSDHPYGPVSRVTGDLRTIHQTGVDHAGLCGMYSPGLSNMLDYLFLRLMKDPSQDPWPIVKEYCDFAYGAAGELILTIVRELDDLWFKPSPFVDIDAKLDAMTIYRGEDLVRWQKALDAAEAAIGDDARAKRMLSWLRWDIDFMTLTFWKEVAAQKDLPVALTPAALWNRMKKTELFQPHRGTDKPPKDGEEPKGKYAKAYAAYLMTKAIGKPLPAPLDALPKDVVVHVIPQCGGYFGLPDADALCGAAKSERLPTNETAAVYAKQKVGYDYYDTNRKRLVRHGEIDLAKMTPGKYEMHDLGKVKIVPGSFIALASWWGVGQSLTNYYPEGDADREFELWASLKFIGPHYGIPTEDGRNRMLCDAFYLVDRNGKKYKGVSEAK